LLDLLNDERLKDICTLHAHPNGQKLVRAIEVCPTAWTPVAPPGVWAVQMMTFVPVPEQMFAPLPAQIEKASAAVSVCTESTAGDLLDADLSSVLEGSCSSPSLQQDTDDEDSGSSTSWRPDADTEDSCDRWAVNVKNTFIDVRSPCASSRQRRRSVPASMGTRPAH